MSRLFPYPLLTIALTIMWLLLQQSAGLGHVLWASSLRLRRPMPWRDCNRISPASAARI
ncbi:hypothetical protein [Devosia aurantiaca]|uniref:hypothetical protein n=1 Tax=Devosia aurantiaca TaxID=2714858 RepID=UPI002E2AD28E|nr:hypothetical protein [Devosia aurantiaca]